MTLLVVRMQEQGRSSYLARSVTQLIRRSIGSEEDWLLKEADPAGVEELDGASMLQHLRLSYPVNIVDIAEDAEKNRIDKLVHSMGQVKLGGSSASND